MPQIDYFSNPPPDPDQPNLGMVRRACYMFLLIVVIVNVAGCWVSLVAMPNLVYRPSIRDYFELGIVYNFAITLVPFAYALRLKQKSNFASVEPYVLTVYISMLIWFFIAAMCRYF